MPLAPSLQTALFLLMAQLTSAAYINITTVSVIELYMDNMTDCGNVTEAALYLTQNAPLLSQNYSLVYALNNSVTVSMDISIVSVRCLDTGSVITLNVTSIHSVQCISNNGNVSCVITKRALDDANAAYAYLVRLANCRSYADARNRWIDAFNYKQRKYGNSPILPRYTVMQCMNTLMPQTGDTNNADSMRGLIIVGSVFGPIFCILFSLICYARVQRFIHNNRVNAESATDSSDRSSTYRITSRRASYPYIVNDAIATVASANPELERLLVIRNFNN